MINVKTITKMFLCLAIFILHNNKYMKIIVIGNGYDLNLGLKSRFGDFYNTFFREKDDVWDYKKIRSNIWSLLLFFRYIEGSNNGLIIYFGASPRWMDVEEFICDVLNDSRTLSLLNEALQERVHYVQGDGKIDGSSFETQAHEIKALAQMQKNDFGIEGVYELLSDNLSQFEEWFINYMDGLNMYQYFSKSDLLMSKLTNDFQNTYVISFNYTKLPSGIFKTNQVHGNLEERNIIIGVDKTKITNRNTRKMRFSKSWRQLSNALSTSMLPAKADVTEIVVFGHSLGGQDYSYFHSLFNFYDIYSSSIKITFLYANYHINKKTRLPDTFKDEEHRIQYIDSVFNLLSDYVEKSLGQKEADSFVTKIQLEGRLSVQEINDYWIKNRKIDEHK